MSEQLPYPNTVCACEKCNQVQFCVAFRYVGFAKLGKPNAYLCAPCHFKLADVIHSWIGGSK